MKQRGRVQRGGYREREVEGVRGDAAVLTLKMESVPQKRKKESVPQSQGTYLLEVKKRPGNRASIRPLKRI